jgi:hypothetical protein
VTLRRVRSNLVKDEKCELVVDSSSIVVRWRKYISQLLNVHGVNVIRKAEIHTAETLVPKPSALSLSWLLKR